MWIYLLLAFVAGCVVSNKITQFMDRLPEWLIEKIGEPVYINELPAPVRREMRRVLWGNNVPVERSSRPSSLTWLPNTSVSRAVGR